MTSENVGEPAAEGTRGDLEWGTTPRLVLAGAARWGDHPAIVDGDTTISYAELADRVEAAARAFLAAGIEPGDRVAIWAPNVWEWVVAALGLHAAGGVLVPLNTRFKGSEAAYVLAKSRARMLFTVTDFLDTDYVEHAARRGRPAGRPSSEIVVLRGAGARGHARRSPTSSGRLAPSPRRGGPRGADGGDARRPLRHPLHVGHHRASPRASMTRATGRPCGPSHDWADVVGLRHGDRYLIVNPFFHAFGLQGRHPRLAS